MDKLDKQIQKYFKLTLTIVIYLFFILITAGGAYKAYTLGSVFCLIIFAVVILIPVIIDNPNISKFILSVGKIKITLELKEDVKKILKSDKSDEDKAQDIQNIIDKVFKLGHQMGSGDVNSICNIKITRDKDGKITGLQYDEN